MSESMDNKEALAQYRLNMAEEFVAKMKAFIEGH